MKQFRTAFSNIVFQTFHFLVFESASGCVLGGGFLFCSQSQSIITDFIFSISSCIKLPLTYFTVTGGGIWECRGCTCQHVFHQSQSTTADCLQWDAILENIWLKLAQVNFLFLYEYQTFQWFQKEHISLCKDDMWLSKILFF